jgi:aminoglycoside phosphotransferase (APT) family kinase protein
LNLVGEVQDFRPLLRDSGRGTVTKAGRIALVAQWRNRTVKVYEAANSTHAAFIRAVSQHAQVGDLFPRVLGLAGPFVIADWAKKATRKPPSPEALVNILCGLHAIDAGDLPAPGFDYWHDLIAPRFRNACFLLDAREICEHVLEVVSDSWDRSPTVLMHPDVTADNLVGNADRSWKLIDNELLTVGGLPVLDACNMVFALRGRRRNEVVRLAAKVLDWTDRAVEVANAAWLARVVGTSLVAGEVAAAKERLDRFDAGESVLPFEV